MDGTAEMYARVAAAMAVEVNQVFASEATMQTRFNSLFPGLPFSRTDHWGGILYKLFHDVWLTHGPAVKAAPTLHDRQAMLRKLCLILDYNLFSQVLLNLQNHTGMAYQARDAEKDIELLKEQWKDSKRSPFEPKARMVKEAATEEDEKYNHDLSTLRSLKIIAAFTPQVSFRVSPKGSTPALADSNNISMLGIGADKYLRVLPGLRAFYVCWEPGSCPQMARHQAIGVTETANQFIADDIPYAFESKSGGEILQDVLFARKLVCDIFAGHDVMQETCILIPRMNSILAVVDERGEHLRQVFAGLSPKYPMLSLVEGIR